MNQPGNSINFVQLLNRQGHVQIPKIQRHYAQGRESQQEILDDFLDVLYKALTQDYGSEFSPVNLDFIYGSVSSKSEEYFFPLDGQQRLTTLFLLHWYLAWKDLRIKEFQGYFVNEETSSSRFSYQTRSSSTDFYDALANFNPREPVSKIKSISKEIQDQSWYLRHWKSDTTVQSSLKALEAIHTKFRGVKQNLFCHLVDEDRSKITFQLLNLGKFNLDDDLYIKMNARGVPLTPFEAFKARYTKFLESSCSNNVYTIDGQSVSEAEYFSRRMDTRWADFFWNHSDKTSNLFDSAAINLFRVIALVTREPKEKDTYLKSLDAFRRRSELSTYSNFRRNDWLDSGLTEGIFLLLDTWSSHEKLDFTKQLPNNKYFDEERIFEKLTKDPISLSLVELVQISGYYFYL